MMYASRVTINEKPQKVRTYKEIELPDGLLTIKDISKHLKKGEKFGFFTKESGWLGSPTPYIGIYGYRYETAEELKERIAKEKQYNENYEKFHAKYKK